LTTLELGYNFFVTYQLFVDICCFICWIN